MLVDTRIVERCAPLAEKMVERRKDPIALCRLLGWKFLFRFLLRQLTLEEAESKVSVLLGEKEWRLFPITLKWAWTWINPAICSWPDNY